MKRTSGKQKEKRMNQQRIHGGLDPVELAIVAAGISRQYGITVTVGGTDTAKTYYDPDGSTTIAIPAIRSDDPMYGTLLRGFIDHEAAHVRFTDMKGLRESAHNESLNSSSMFLSILNILEDVYVERKMSGCFRGCAFNLGRIANAIFMESRTAKSKVESGWMSYIEPEDANTEAPARHPVEPTAALFDWILYTVRSVNSASGITQDVLDIIEAACGKFGLSDLLDSIRPILARVPAEGTSTLENARLAHEILDKMNEWSKSSAERDSGSGTDDQNSRVESVSRGSKAFSRAASSCSDIPKKREKDVEEYGSWSVSHDLKSNDAYRGNTNCKDVFDDKSFDTVMDALGSIGGDTNMSSLSSMARATIGSIANSEQSSTSFSVNGQIVKSDRGRFQPLRLMSRETAKQRKMLDELKTMSPQRIEADQMSSRLASRMSALLQAYTMKRSGTGRIGGVDTHKLHRLSVNDARVFDRKEVKPGVNTEFIVMYDNSSSMRSNSSGRYAHAAGDPSIGVTTGYAVYGIMKALRRLRGTTSSAWAWSSFGMFPVYDKGDPVVHPVIAEPDGSTPLAESMVKAMYVFNQDPLSRKVLIVLTDGVPDDESMAKSAIAKVQELGVTVVACGIGCYSETVANLFDGCADSSLDLSDMRNVPDKLFSIIRKNIVEGGL